MVSIFLITCTDRVIEKGDFMTRQFWVGLVCTILVFLFLLFVSFMIRFMYNMTYSKMAVYLVGVFVGIALYKVVAYLIKKAWEYYEKKR